jgi:hypothetical protein
MSEYCPVYAPFFGAMVSLRDGLRVCRSEIRITNGETGLRQRHYLHM